MGLIHEQATACFGLPAAVAVAAVPEESGFEGFTGAVNLLGRDMAVRLGREEIIPARDKASRAVFCAPGVAMPKSLNIRAIAISGTASVSVRPFDVL